MDNVRILGFVLHFKNSVWYNGVKGMSPFYYIETIILWGIDSMIKVYGTETKKMLNILILEILRTYSDQDHHLTQQEII